jgi:hypothetical protein
MLLNCVISFLYMRALEIIFGKYFSTLFPLFSSFLCEASRRWFYMSRRCCRFVRMFLIQVRTERQVCPDVPIFGPGVPILGIIIFWFMWFIM